MSVFVKFQGVMLQKYIQMNIAAVIFLGNSFNAQNHKIS